MGFGEGVCESVRVRVLIFTVCGHENKCEFKCE